MSLSAAALAALAATDLKQRAVLAAVVAAADRRLNPSRRASRKALPAHSQFRSLFIAGEKRRWGFEN